MGQAKIRGTKEERIRQAIKSKEVIPEMGVDGESSGLQYCKINPELLDWTEDHSDWDNPISVTIDFDFPVEELKALGLTPMDLPGKALIETVTFSVGTLPNSEGLFYWDTSADINYNDGSGQESSDSGWVESIDLGKEACYLAFLEIRKEYGC